MQWRFPSSASTLATAPAHAQAAQEVKVMISGGFSAAYDALVPQFEAGHGYKVVTVHGPSIGTTRRPFPTAWRAAKRRMSSSLPTRPWAN